MSSKHENSAVNGLSVSQWLSLLTALDADSISILRECYGDCYKDYIQSDSPLILALNRYLDTYGDDEVRIFRAPGRVNLRGMHVDTHGGYQNLMAHQSEVVVVAAQEESGRLRLVNVDAKHPDLDTNTDDFTDGEAFKLGWEDFITHPDIEAKRKDTPGHWQHYALGALLRVQYDFKDEALCGIRGAVAGSVPQGAALSSSAALCVALVQAGLGLNSKSLSSAALILASRDAEWFSGARTGTADQTAVIMSKPGQIVHGPLFSEDFSTDTLRYTPFPDDLRLLVIQSNTSRNLSGSALIAYTANRFAYSMAMAVLQQVCDRLGIAHVNGAKLNRLANLSPTLLGGEAELYRALREIPEEMHIEAIQAQYHIPDFKASYMRYFGGVPEADRPTQIPLRGPLLFGIAESERGRVFAQLLAAEAYMEAGALMTAGHNGDRVMNPDGTAYPAATTWDDATPVTHIPGAYGASSPALDALVDAALAGGALGASLTGAGIAGTVLALCKADNVDAVAETVMTCLESPDYAKRAGFEVPLSATQARESVALHHAIAGAGELVITYK